MILLYYILSLPHPTTIYLLFYVFIVLILLYIMVLFNLYFFICFCFICFLLFYIIDLMKIIMICNKDRKTYAILTLMLNDMPIHAVNLVKINYL